MENITFELLKIFCFIIHLIIMMIFLFVLLSPFAYVVLYLLDILWVNRPFFNSNSNENLVRYETPIVTYNFSSITIIFVNNIFFGGNVFSYLALSFGFCLLYFFAMCRKLWHDKETLRKAWENNKAYLKLSLMIISFMYAVIGLVITVAEFFHLSYADLEMLIKSLINTKSHFQSISTLSAFFKELIEALNMILPLTFISYLFSLPLRFISYLIIKIGEYFWKYKEPYKKYFVCLLNFIVCILNLIFIGFRSLIKTIKDIIEEWKVRI